MNTILFSKRLNYMQLTYHVLSAMSCKILSLMHLCGYMVVLTIDMIGGIKFTDGHRYWKPLYLVITAN